MNRSPLLERFYPESRFGGFTDIDGTIHFYLRVNALLHAAGVVLDFGCGRGQDVGDGNPTRQQLSRLRGKVARVIGMDVDRACAGNPLLDEFRLLDGGPHWPAEDRSISLILCDNVLEHLPEPRMFFREAQRILKPGGYICIRTPNLFSYLGLATRVIPNSLHTRVLSQVQKNRKKEDVFPTLYRCNTVFCIRRMMRKHGFNGVAYGYEPEPTYLDFSSVTFWLGTMHQKFAPRALAPMILAFGVKSL